MIAVALLASSAAAQPVAPDRPALNQPSGALPSRFTKVEQTVGDVDPLSTSIRLYSTDLRLPTGFRDVFRIQGTATQASRWGVANPGGADLLARMDGAITAVFPQSVYVDTRKGAVAVIPPGTVFFIGALPFDRFQSAEAPPPSPNQIDTRVDMRADASVVPSQPQVNGPLGTAPPPKREEPKPTNRPLAENAPTTPSPGIMTDEPLRRKTIRELIMRAADTAAKPVPVRDASSKERAPVPGVPEKKTAPEKPERR